MEGRLHPDIGPRIFVTPWCNLSAHPPAGPSLHIQNQSTPQPLSCLGLSLHHLPPGHPLPSLVYSPLSSQRDPLKEVRPHPSPVVQSLGWKEDLSECEAGRIRALKPREPI